MSVSNYRRREGWVFRRSEYSAGWTEQWWPDDGVMEQHIVLSVMRQSNSSHRWLPEPEKFFVVDHTSRQPGDRTAVTSGPYTSLRAAKVALLLARSRGSQ